MPRPPASPLLVWSQYLHTNCWWDGNGAEDEIEEPRGSAAPGITTLVACKAACIAAIPACGGVLFSTQSQCYRKGPINVEKCHGQANLDLYKLEWPSPPTPPTYPPAPPMEPVAPAVRMINEQFRTGRPSDTLADIGLLMHQWDGLEEQGRAWEMCIRNCVCQGATIDGRISAMAIYQGLRDRIDRIAVPLPFGDRGGILLNPKFATLDCLYGIDGATYNIQNSALPGCSQTFCDARDPYDRNGVQLCGFNGAPAAAWAPQDLKKLLELHAAKGALYHAPGWHSGYNEFILNSRQHNLYLPESIQAFFFPKGQSPQSWGLGYGVPVDVVELHRKFLQRYDKSDHEVPLLVFDPANWEQPFERYVA
jgi:hypothetical protein